MAPLSRKTSYTTQVALQRCPILYMSKSGFMIPPWPATVNRLPAHHEFPFPAVDIPACGGIIPPCGAVCVPFWNAIYIFLHSRGWVKPDFTALNVRTRRIRYWEHYGKMGDPDYCADNLEKTLDYERDGYFPGTHLIITHETQERPADTRLLEAVARHYLL